MREYCKETSAVNPRTIRAIEASGAWSASPACCANPVAVQVTRPLANHTTFDLDFAPRQMIRGSSDGRANIVMNIMDSHDVTCDPKASKESCSGSGYAAG